MNGGEVGGALRTGRAWWVLVAAANMAWYGMQVVFCANIALLQLGSSAEGKYKRQHAHLNAHSQLSVLWTVKTDISEQPMFSVMSGTDESSHQSPQFAKQ